MTVNLYWMQCGGCGGDTMSLLNADAPDLLDALAALDVRVLWHPSLSSASPAQHIELIECILGEELPLDIFCVEGAVVRGPTGTGLFETFAGRPKKDLVARLASKARFVVAVGTCASFGGISADCAAEACGLQFLKWEKGGFLGRDFAARSGLPVVNLPGCPCHPDVVTGTLMALVQGAQVALDAYNTPSEWYGMLVHQGCTRNEYHEYRVEERDFGEKGCLFFHMGCQGPLAHGPCNKLLWNRRNSKTRAGTPCFGCTRPGFPQEEPFFQTPNIEELPLVLPEGVDRAHYMAYKGMAAAAAPQRLKDRRTEV
ncbi:MAG: NADH:ubiquinone oxidoreductase [Planctomycetes bacterium]|nr:NADH:ubiquinone oxidoreductase [Planctomycetota bacterium]